MRSFFACGLALGWVVLAGCHPGTRPAARPREAQLEPRLVLGAAGETKVATLVRPTPGVVRLSLFLDAGARDAEPAQVATLAAWLAAERAGPAALATVYPDVTEITLPCSNEKLQTCLQALQAALATRSPSEAETQRARVRLAAGRRQALAADPGREADRLALQALLGDAAGGFFPLGMAEDDARASAAAVAAFLQDHYGRERALLVAAGDVLPEQVQAAVSDRFAAAPHALQARAARARSPRGEPKLALALADRDLVALALTAPDTAQAYAYVAQLERVLGRGTDELGIAVRGQVFSVRAGALALVQLTGASLAQRVERSAAELARLQLEPPGALAAPSSRDDLATLSRRLGLDFGARSLTTPSTGMAFALGVLADAGRADRPRLKDPDAAERARRSQQLQEAFARGLATARPKLRGEANEHAASLVMENAVRLDVRRTSSERVAIAVRIALGAQEDPPLLHGRGALLAELTTTACAGLRPDQLGAELERLGASLTPRIDAESYGSVLMAPSSQWRPALDLALRCLRAPSLTAASFAQAALRLQQRLREQHRDPLLHAQLAALIAPRAPGLYAPLGSPERLGNLGLRELAELLPAARSGARWAVAIVGPVEVQEAAARAARRLASLPAGSIASPKSPGELAAEAAPTVTPGSAAVDGVRGLLVWLSHAPTTPSPVAARVLASAAQQWLVHSGLQPLSHEGDAGRWGALAAVELHVPPELVPRLPQLFASATRHLDAAALTQPLTAALAAEQLRRAAAGSRVDVRADRLARERLGEREPELSLEAALRQLELLRQASPLWQPLD